MVKIKKYFLVSIKIFLLVPGISFAQLQLLVDDFNSGKMVNILGGNNGCWNINPSDTMQYCKASFDKINRIGDQGFGLKLDYNINTIHTYEKDFPRTAANGFFVLLNNSDLTNYSYLLMYIRGDKDLGFTHRVTLELKNRFGQTSKFILEGISDQWKMFVVPLGQFREINNWSSMTELVITFDKEVTRKTGIIFIDNIMFSKIPGQPKAKVSSVKKNKNISIDGDLSEWEGIKLIHLDNLKNIEEGNIKNENDLDVSFALLYDTNFLYIAIVVNDDKLVFEQSKKEDIFQKDSICLYFDKDNDGFKYKPNSDLLIGIVPKENDKKTLIWESILNRDLSDIISANVNMNTIEGKNGYQMEVAIPWDLIGIEPKENQIISYTFTVNDFDSESIPLKRLSWGSVIENNYLLLGNIILSK